MFRLARLEWARQKVAEPGQNYPVVEYPVKLSGISFDRKRIVQIPDIR